MRSKKGVLITNSKEEYIRCLLPTLMVTGTKQEEKDKEEKKEKEGEEGINTMDDENSIGLTSKRKTHRNANTRCMKRGKIILTDAPEPTVPPP